MKQRTNIAVWSAALAVVAALTGCGAATGGSGATQNAPSHTEAASSTAAFPITLTDDTGTKVTIQKEPMHIVSGTEGTDEILVSLVPKSRISLVTNLSSDATYSDVTSLVKGIHQWSGEDAEQALAVNPDLVLMASYAPQKVVSQIRSAGVPVYEFNDFTSVAMIEHNIAVIGKLVGEPQKAKAIVNNMNHNIANIEHAVAAYGRPTVLDYSSYGYAAGQGTTVNDIIRMAGGTNAAAGLNGWAKITDEEIVKLNPSVIIDSSDDAAFLKKLASDPALQSVAAVREHHLYAIDSADLSSVSQYVVKGVYDVAKVIHPNAHVPAVQVLS
ncbi:iron complex transport system substrate-binding protein [Alicyclobacillus sacchari]|uniref:Iron complex transport system substrate-binding protein n=2 Tax=Alicyclobacillus sacchari TaxID=392010 RepID=A0A4R8LRF9_9BACL|nr:ABC transporter substrate-binding protein [Alicyclobacillus sacchari]TDY47964.1 iron complex transport system substrate-binding protein [Alicyclobacillus sacchari]